MMTKIRCLKFTFFILFNYLLILPMDAKELLKPYRASYDISVLDAKGLLSSCKIEGSLITEFQLKDDQYYNSKNLILKIRALGLLLLDTKSSSKFFEARNGNFLKFAVEIYNKGKIESSFSGEARKKGQNVTIKYKIPKEETIILENIYFPVEAQQILLKKAKKGIKSYFISVFGAEDSKKVKDEMKTSVSIGDKQKYKPSTETGPDASLANLFYWPVKIDTLDQNNKPIASSSFDLFENGVRTNMIMGKKSLKIKMQLKELHYL